MIAIKTWSHSYLSSIWGLGDSYFFQFFFRHFSQKVHIIVTISDEDAGELLQPVQMKQGIYSRWWSWRSPSLWADSNNTSFILSMGRFPPPPSPAPPLDEILVHSYVCACVWNAERVFKCIMDINIMEITHSLVFYVQEGMEVLLAEQ